MPDKKQLMTISDVMAWVTRTRGVTQVSIIDHDMTPMMKDGVKTKYGLVRLLNKIITNICMKNHLSSSLTGDSVWAGRKSIPLHHHPKEQDQLLPSQGDGRRHGGC